MSAYTYTTRTNHGAPTPWVLGVINDDLQLRWNNHTITPITDESSRKQDNDQITKSGHRETGQQRPVRPVEPRDKMKWISQAFAMAKALGEGYHLLVDHSQLSQYLKAPHFKMSRIKEVVALLKPGAYLAKKTKAILMGKSH